MARASTHTLLSLDEWAAILGISPFEFNQAVYPAPKSAQCKDVFYQWQWQKDHLGREEVAEAIASAEQMIRDSLLFWPAPYYTVDEVIPYPRPYQRNLFGMSGTWRGEWKTFGTKHHKVIKGGVLNRTAIATIGGADLTKLDLDSDGVFETFQAVITNVAIGTITDVDEIALYFIAANRHGEGISETWRIRPVNVSVTGNTATITGHRTLLINPVPEFVVNPTELDATVDGNYVTSVECYRTFTDDTATAALPYQGVAMWKDIPGCTAGCTFTIKELCLGQHQNEQGQIFASFDQPCTWPFPDREPDRLQINYVSGLPLENGKMQHVMAQIVTYLSVSLLANEPCGCDRTNRILARWKAPITKFVDNTANASAFADSVNLFPMTYGGQWAWKRCNDFRHIEVVGI